MAHPIALISGDFVPTGGMDRANLALADYCARSADISEVHIVAHRADPQLLRRATVRMHRATKPLHSYSLGEPFLVRAGQKCARQVTAAGGRVLVNGGNCTWHDINWVHYVHAAWQAPADGLGPLRRAMTAWKQRRFGAAEAAIIPAATLVIANSRRTKDDLVKRLRVSEDRVKVVYYGSDSHALSVPTNGEKRELRTRIGWSTDRPIVAFVGALGDRRKGFDLIFDAWLALCCQREWDADLVVMGTGAELQQWRRRAEQNGLSERIRLLGFRSDVPQLLRACDALVAPTRYEAYGLAVHEAIACGLPALVSAHAGVAERYPADLAALKLSDPEDVAAVIESLRAWRNDLERWATTVRNASAQWRARSWDDMAEDIVRLMHEHSAGHVR